MSGVALQAATQILNDGSANDPEGQLLSHYLLESFLPNVFSGHFTTHFLNTVSPYVELDKGHI